MSWHILPSGFISKTLLLTSPQFYKRIHWARSQGCKRLGAQRPFQEKRQLKITKLTKNMINTKDASQSYLSVLSEHSDNVATEWALCYICSKLDADSEKRVPKEKNLLGKSCYGWGKLFQSEMYLCFAIYGLHMFCVPLLLQFYPTTTNFISLIPSTCLLYTSRCV